MAIQRPSGFVFIMIYHWIATVILVATGAGLLHDAFMDDFNIPPLFLIAYILAAGMLGLSLWCCLLGWLLHTRYSPCARCVEITHGCIAVLTGLFSLICLGVSLYVFIEIRLNPGNFRGEAGMGGFLVCAGAVVGAAALLLVFGSIWVMRCFAAARRSSSWVHDG